MKVAIVSGGTSGIGTGAVQVLLDEGYHVVTFSRNKESCDALRKKFTENVTITNADVADETAMKQLVDDTIVTHGRIDVLVNNAGWGYWTSVDDVDLQRFKDLLDTNIVGVATLTKHVVSHMKKAKKGQIINIASIAGKKGYVQGAFYCASKFAVMGYSESIRMELRPFGVKVCTICPGMTATNLFPDEVLEKRKKITGSLQMMDVEDVARTIRLVATQSKTSDINDITINAAHQP